MAFDKTTHIVATVAKIELGGSRKATAQTDALLPCRRADFNSTRDLE